MEIGSTLSVAYSPDDLEIVYGMVNGEVLIWNRDTDKTHKLGRHTRFISSVAFSPDGSRIASGSFDKTVKIGDPRLRRTIDDEEASLEDLRGVALSHDGGWIVTASHCHIQVWRVTETVTKANELVIGDNVESLALSRDGSHVVLGCADRSIQVWNHFTNKKECQMSGHSDKVRSVALSHNVRLVVSGSEDNTVRIWDSHKGEELACYQHCSKVTSVTFSRNSCHVAFGSCDGTVAKWNLLTGEIQGREYSNPAITENVVYSIAFSHDDSHVIYGTWRGVWIWNLTTNDGARLYGQIQLPDGTRVHSLGFIHFHIYDPVDQEMTNNIPPYLLRISQHNEWIIGEQAENKCWIPPHYRNFKWVYVAKSIVCLGYVLEGIIVLDLKGNLNV